MSQDHEYVCNKCGDPTKRSLLTVKKVLFTDMGAGSKTLRSRVIGWYCPPCTVRDSEWNLPAHKTPNTRLVDLLGEENG